ncbi:MAG: hypothetical protein WBA28_06165 [Microbacteriaceae bacterium]
MQNPFEYRITKDMRVLIYRSGALVMNLGGDRAGQLITKLGIDEETDQELLARITGNYKQGNERSGKRSSKK